MNKAELIAAVAEKTGLSKKDSEKAVSAVFASITEGLKKGEKLSLVGFGTFEVKACLTSRSAAPVSAATPRPRKRSRSRQRACLFSRRARCSRTRFPNKNDVKRSGMTGAFLSGGALCVWINI